MRKMRTRFVGAVDILNYSYKNSNVTGERWNEGSWNEYYYQLVLQNWTLILIYLSMPRFMLLFVNPVGISRVNQPSNHLETIFEQ
jgi:hypothetical protein